MTESGFTNVTELGAFTPENHIYTEMTWSKNTIENRIVYRNWNRPQIFFYSYRKKMKRWKYKIVYSIYSYWSGRVRVRMCARVYIFLVIRACVRAGKLLALLVYQDTARMRVRASCACMRVRMWIAFMLRLTIVKMNVCCYHVPDAKNEIQV